MDIDTRPARLWSGGYINVCIANFLMACSFNLLMPTIPLYITEVLGVAQSKTGIVLASYAIALLFVRPFSGYFVDLYSRKKILLVSFIGFVAIFSGYFFVTTVFFFVIIRFLHGITWGFTTVSSSTLAIDLVPSERRAEGIGYYGTFTNVAMAMAPFIAIYIYESHGFPMLLVAAMVIVALAFFGFALYHNIYAFCLAGFFIGIGFGMMFPALQTLYINMADNNQRGTANSTYLVGFDLGLALGMLLGGFISGHHSFEALFMVAGLVCVISVVIYGLVSKPLFERKRLR